MTDYLCRHTLGRTSTVPIRQSTAPDSPLQAGTVSHFKERPRLPCADFNFDRGAPAPRAKLSILSKVLASSPRIASWVWIIFEDPRPCPSIPLRGSSRPSILLRRSSCELRSSFGGVLHDHLIISEGVRSRIIFDNPRSFFVLGMTWRLLPSQLRACARL